MPNNTSATNCFPLCFDPTMEIIGPDEAKTNEALIETLGKISQITFDHSGHATRSVHAKAHGVLRGELTILDDLPEHLAQGLFAKPGTYAVAMRFSTLPGDILDDNVSTPRGLAIKAIDVEGPRMPGSEADTTQDFVMVNGPAFGAPNAEKFLGVLKMLAATTDKAEGLKKAVSAVAQVTESIIEAFGGKSPTLTTMGGQKETNILGETFYSQVPILYGKYIAKYSVAPLGPLKALTDSPVEMTDNPNALREAVAEHFASNGGDWEFRVQLCTDLQSMPIEDATVVWPEDKSAYLVVARLHVDQQPSWSPAQVAAIDDGLAFSPWHGLAAHRPLGSVMRARNTTYKSSANFRGTHNGCPIREPRAAGDVKA